MAKSINFANFGAFQWRAFQSLRSLILDSGGFIFGGYVRDAILHDRAAKEFYTHCNKCFEQGKEAPSYTDTFAEPGTKDRLLVPKDIDVVFYNQVALELLEIKIKESHDFHLKIKRKSKKYPPQLDTADDFVLYKLIITCKMSKLLNTYIENEPCFEIDALVYNGSDSGSGIYSNLPPFGPTDFECNTLVMFSMHGQEIITMNNKYNEKSGFELHEEVHRIMQDILQRKAIFTHKQPVEWRVRKMLEKGFTIETTHVKVIDSIEANDVCVICHNEINSMHMKRNCCNAVYHAGCLHDVLKKCQECPQCRNEFVESTSIIDAALCECIDGIADDKSSIASSDDDNDPEAETCLPSGLLDELESEASHQEMFD